jgi:hypothetical protein
MTVSTPTKSTRAAMSGASAPLGATVRPGDVNFSVFSKHAATTTIPIVFTVAGDPVQIGLVASLARPGGNVTGATQFALEVTPKALELAHELVPTATVIAALVNPTNPFAETLLRDLQEAARILGVQLHFLHASTDRDFDTVSASLAQLRVGVRTRVRPPRVVQRFRTRPRGSGPRPGRRRPASRWWPLTCRSRPSAMWRSPATSFVGYRPSGITDRNGDFS